MIQRLSKAFAQVKAGNNSKSLLNEIRNCLSFKSTIIKNGYYIYEIWE